MNLSGKKEFHANAPVVIFTFPGWEVSGVSTVNLNLAVALRDLGIRCILVVENDNRDDCPYELPEGVECKGLLGAFHWWCWIPSRSIGFRLRSMLTRYRLRKLVASYGNVALIPGYAHSLVNGLKPFADSVGCFGVVHAEDETNVGFARKEGQDWVKCICVSSRVAARVNLEIPWISPILKVIENGVPCSSSPPVRPTARADGRLHVTYAGRLSQLQKRIGDLATLIETTTSRGLPICWHIAGEGTEQEILHTRLKSHIEAGSVHWHGSITRGGVRELFARSDMMIMVSDFEGMPMSLLEAMAEGCVPIVSEGCDAGAELVRSKNAGYVIETGNVEGFATVFEEICNSVNSLETYSTRAWSAIAHGPHSVSVMGNHYLDSILEWARTRKSLQKAELPAISIQ